MLAIPSAALLALVPAGAVLSETRPAFASLATVTVASADAAGARAGIEAAFAHLDRVDWAMNEWRAGSPLARLNGTAGRWVPIPADLCRLLRVAKDGAERTGGLFDPTWAAVSDLWRFDGSGTVPPAALLRARCPLVDHRGLELRSPPGGACEARLARPGMRVGLGGIAKGWALDSAARALRGLGLRDFLLQAGGDLYAAGSRLGEPWPIAIRDPSGPGAPLGTLLVSDRALSTTGDYEHAFESGGRRYHHVIDPRTCQPAPASRSVTVLARTAVDAEIVGKAAFVAGGGEALAIARSFGAEAVVVAASGEVLATPGIPPPLAPVSREGPPPHGGAGPPSRGPVPGTPRRRRHRLGAPPPRARPRPRAPPGSSRTRSPPR
ncbi:MAG TPA: FAD:protein FMN transferase [Anaeromyxobacteraceae bacterium]|nr:FAD:protein FMN transferase [Anaeromyxobacteraceae bacterium]